MSDIGNGCLIEISLRNNDCRQFGWKKCSQVCDHDLKWAAVSSDAVYAAFVNTQKQSTIIFKFDKGRLQKLSCPI